MAPSPPRLEEKAAEWSDEDLFWIVKNGIKYSGMPAWPAQDRDDEVWAQVAFLRALPDMTRAEYADLALGGGLADDGLEAGGETTAALDGIFETALADCARCHGRDGLGAVEQRRKTHFRSSPGSQRRTSTRRCAPLRSGDGAAASWSPPRTGIRRRYSRRWGAITQSSQPCG